MVLSPLLQVAAVVTSAVEPSEYVPIAFSGAEVPLASDTGDGDTASDVSVGAPQAGSRKLAIRVLQLNAPFVSRYSLT